MFAQIATIDEFGRVTLPEQALAVLGISDPHDAEVIIELTEEGVVIRPKNPLTPITDRLAAMNLPVADWDQMEQEIEAGHLA